jgi:hypothetical protein
MDVEEVKLVDYYSNYPYEGKTVLVSYAGQPRCKTEKIPMADPKVQKKTLDVG